MTSVTYILATYGGSDIRSISDSEEPPREDYLRIHLSKLEKTDLSLVERIVISKPQTDYLIPSYYEIDEAKKNFKSKLVEFPLENAYLSYGQYISVVRNFPETDYYIVIEDDYFPTIPNFVSELIRIHKKKLSKGGYLCSFKSTYSGCFPPHAANSNGIIDGSSFRNALLENPNPLIYSEPFTAKEYWRTCPQISFSLIFKDRIKDFSQEYNIPFWGSSSSLKKVIYLSDYLPERKSLFCPIQQWKDC